MNEIPLNTIKKLFLDDVREPMDAFSYTNDSIYTLPNWDIVKNYDEFVGYIEENGVPKIISLDHDLADIHYEKFLKPPSTEDKQQAWDDYHKEETRERTGYDCLKWLIDYCHDNGIVFPKLYIHTMNNIGYQNMVYYYRGAIRNRFIKIG